MFLVFLITLMGLHSAASAESPGLGDACNSTVPCSAGFQECNSTSELPGVCICIDNYLPEGKNCLAPVGEECLDGASTTYTACQNPLTACLGGENNPAKCLCKDGYLQYAGKCLAPLNDICLESDGCYDHNAICVPVPETTTSPAAPTVAATINTLARAPALFKNNHVMLASDTMWRASGNREVVPKYLSPHVEQLMMCVCDDGFEIDDSTQPLRCKQSGSCVAGPFSLMLIVFLALLTSSR